MSISIGVPVSMRQLAARAARRKYPRACPNRGAVIGMVEDAGLPPGIRLKQWACNYWNDGVTWKTCKYRSKKTHCNEHAPQEVINGA